MTSKRLSALEQRLVNALAAFDFQIQYKSGFTNNGADTLSRIRHRYGADMDSEEIDSCLQQVTQSTELPPEVRTVAVEDTIESLELDDLEPAPEDRPVMSLPTVPQGNMGQP